MPHISGESRLRFDQLNRGREAVQDLNQSCAN